MANAGQRALTFLLLPLYVAVLSPAEYGRLGLLLTIQSAAATLFTAGMDLGVMRRYFQLDSEGPSRSVFIITAWSFLTLGSLVLAGVAALVTIFLIPTSSVFNPSQGALAILGAAVFVGATVVPLTVLRAEYALRKYLMLTAVLAVSTAVFTVLSVVVFKFGVTGWLVATLAANLLALVAAMLIVPWRVPTTIDRRGLREALRIGLPLVPHAASGWSLQLADRIILASLVTVSALGIYTLAANLALPVMFILQGLNMGFLPVYARAQTDHDAVASLQHAVTLQIALTLLLGCLVGLLGPPAIALFSSDYAGAGSLVPWIVLGYVFLGLYFVPMNIISMVVGRTDFVWTLTFSAAAVNIGAIYLLVPRYGTLGAAIASAIGYLLLLGLISLYSRIVQAHTHLDWPRVVPMTATACAIFAIGFVLPETGLMATMLRATCIVPLPILLLRASGISVSGMPAQLRTRLRP